jgi:hypothetical protein
MPRVLLLYYTYAQQARRVADVMAETFRARGIFQAVPRRCHPSRKTPAPEPMTSKSHSSCADGRVSAHTFELLLAIRVGGGPRRYAMAHALDIACARISS